MYIFCMILRKNVPYLLLCQLKKFQCHNSFPSKDTKKKYCYELLIYTIDDA